VDHPGAKVTEQEVREIRYMCSGKVRGTQAEACRKYGLSRAQVCGIVKRKFWRHVY
jgi:hypothetical protein